MNRRQMLATLGAAKSQAPAHRTGDNGGLEVTPLEEGRP